MARSCSSGTNNKSLEKSLRGRSGTAQTGPQFSTSPLFRLGLAGVERRRVGCWTSGSRWSPAGRTEQRRGVPVGVHGLSTEFSCKQLCREVVTRLTSFIAFAGMFLTLSPGPFLFYSMDSHSSRVCSIGAAFDLMQHRKPIQSSP